MATPWTFQVEIRWSFVSASSHEPSLGSGEAADTGGEGGAKTTPKAIEDVMYQYVCLQGSVCDEVVHGLFNLLYQFPQIPRSVVLQSSEHGSLALAFIKWSRGGRELARVYCLCRELPQYLLVAYELALQGLVAGNGRRYDIYILFADGAIGNPRP